MLSVMFIHNLSENPALISLCTLYGFMEAGQENYLSDPYSCDVNSIMFF